MLRFMFLVLLLAACCQLSAQHLIRGRVTNAQDGTGLPGVTVLLPGTTIGVSSSSDGSFELSIPTDTARLQFSSIGFLSQMVRCRANEPVAVALQQDTRQIVDCVMAPPRYEISLFSGLLHTPAGALASWRPPHVPAKLTGGYQTNFRRNQQVVAAAQSNDLYRGYWFNAGLNLEHRRLRIQPNSLRFSSSVLTANLSFPSYGYVTLLLGGGHAQRRTESSQREGYGYQFGGGHHLSGPGLTLVAVATRWPGYWQLQGSASRSFWRVTASLHYLQIKSYHELNLRATYPIY